MQRKRPSGTPRRAPSSVDDYLAALDHPRKREIEALRAIVLRADPRVREEVKWNAPSFFIEEHFATFKLRPGDTLQVVLHTGAKGKPSAGTIEIDDPAKLVKWVAKDRGVATFGDMQDIASKEAVFVAILEQWIAKTTRA